MSRYMLDYLAIRVIFMGITIKEKDYAQEKKELAQRGLLPYNP